MMPSKNKPMILLAEDEPNIVFSLSYVLERAGFEIEVCTDGAQVENKVRATFPNLIILDLMLPNKSGFEIMSDLKSQKRTSNIPILVLSARGQESDMTRAKELGANQYLTKPFSNAEVIKISKELLNIS